MTPLSCDLPGLLKRSGIGYPAPHVVVDGLSYDSRAVSRGDLFFAIPGATVDGAAFARAAVENGAVAVVSERPLALSVPVVEVPSTLLALSAVANAFFGEPSRTVPVIGVTGTNGKSTTTYVIEDIFSAAGMGCAVMGTIDAHFGALTRPAANTTPMPLDVHRFLHDVAAAGARAVAMEVSSHALALGRVAHVRFAAGVFTNLTQDHLDFHGDMETYFSAKRALFAMAETAAVNVDDPYGRRLAEAMPQALTFGATPAAQLRAEAVHCGLDGSHFDLVFPDGRRCPVRSNLMGAFNVSNALAAAAGARAAGVDAEAIVAGLSRPHRVPGRLESIPNTRGFAVLIDYAHTPDALGQALRTLRDTKPRRLICVFGAGGDRDRRKRPLMGRVAAEFADVVILTSDNPRSEDPLAILSDIREGLPPDNGAEHAVLPDRGEAIAEAIRRAAPGDIVLIAGKGHETDQIFRDRREHFSDQETAAKALG